jgi:two-component system, NtrC family, sensor histidine kinase HydH
MLSRIAAFFGLGEATTFRPLQVFSVWSMITIGVIASVSAILQSRFLTSQILLRDATVTHEFLQSIVNAEGSAQFFLDLEAPEAQDRLQSFFKHIDTIPDVIASNVYDTKGFVLWSSNPAVAGAHYDDNDELKRALAGNVVFETGVVGTSDKEEHNRLGDEHLGARFVETYMPIINTQSRKIVGVVEVYKVPLALDRAISGGLKRLWTGALVAATLLFLALSWIVRRSAQLIDEKNRKLAEVQSMAMIGETAAAVTHSIRNPLASIRAAAEIALTDDLEGARESARDIIVETDRLTRWTRELLLFSRVPNSDAQEAALDLNALVGDVVRDFQSSNRNDRLGFSTVLAPGLPRVRGHSEPATHVVTSMIANASESMPKGGSIRLETRLRPEGGVLLTVSDNGPGLAPDMREKALKPFCSTKPGGTGLGLPLAHQIMERFGGTLLLRPLDKGLAVDLVFRAK